jgi:hypothetical protein
MGALVVIAVANGKLYQETTAEDKILIFTAKEESRGSFFAVSGGLSQEKHL